MKLFAHIFGPKGVDKVEVIPDEPIAPEPSPFAWPDGKVPHDSLGGLDAEERDVILDDMTHVPNPSSMGDVHVPLDFFERADNIGRFSVVPKSKCFPRRQRQFGKFRWETASGDVMLPSEMATPHLFYAVRMLYNHSVSPFLRVGQWKRRDGVADWPIDYRTQAFVVLRNELAKRVDLDEWMRGELYAMNVNTFSFAFAFHRVYNVPRAPMTEKEMREYLVRMGVDPNRYIPAPKVVVPDDGDFRRAKRMKRAVATTLTGFPGKRCMEHRSYAGIHRPRVDCNACKQVFNARRRKLRKLSNG